jgi:hypothetical protein
MFARSFKFAALFAVILSVFLAAPAMAASALIDDSGGSKSGKGGDYEMERDLGNGLRVVCRGVVSNNGDDRGIWVLYTVTSEEDMILKAHGEDTVVYDSAGRQFGYWGKLLIGDVKTNEREIIGGVPTLVEVIYYTSIHGYKLTDKYPKVTANIQGQILTFRDVPQYK